MGRVKSADVLCTAHFIIILASLKGMHLGFSSQVFSHERGNFQEHININSSSHIQLCSRCLLLI